MSPTVDSAGLGTLFPLGQILFTFHALPMRVSYWTGSKVTLNVCNIIMALTFFPPQGPGKKSPVKRRVPPVSLRYAGIANTFQLRKPDT